MDLLRLQIKRKSFATASISFCTSFCSLLPRYYCRTERGFVYPTFHCTMPRETWSCYPSSLRLNTSWRETWKFSPINFSKLIGSWRVRSRKRINFSTRCCQSLSLTNCDISDPWIPSDMTVWRWCSLALLGSPNIALQTRVLKALWKS